MKKLSLKFRKMMAMILKAISIIVTSIGGVIGLGFCVFMIYLIFTHTHNGYFDIPNSTRLFSLELLAIASMIILTGITGLWKAENVLLKIRWRT